MGALDHFDNLSQLASEKSSQSRRALLKEIGDMFFDDKSAKSAGLMANFESVFKDLANQAAVEARMELAERCAKADNVPKGLILQLARDAIEVAAPILSQSDILDESDLIDIVQDSSQSHMRAIAGRKTLGSNVSDAIVEHGDDQTLGALVENPGANLSRSAFETVTRRAEANPTLQSRVVERKDTPNDLLADLMLVVSKSLRDIITTRFDNLEPSVVEAAMVASQRRLKARVKEEADLAEAEAFIAKKKLRKGLDGPLLVELLRTNKRTHFCVGFGELTGQDYLTVKRALNHETVEPLALICKAADLERALFVTFAVLRSKTDGDEMAAARDYGQSYESLTQADAERALRFIQVRAKISA